MLGFVWAPTDDRKLAIRGSAGIFYDQNHFNYNDVYVNQTLLADRAGSTSTQQHRPTTRSTTRPMACRRPRALRAFLGRIAFRSFRTSPASV